MTKLELTDWEFVVRINRLMTLNSFGIILDKIEVVLS